MPQLVVVGAGVIGLSCAWYAQKHGWSVTIVDADFEGDRASHGNAGGIATTECIPLSLAGMGIKPLKWLLDPLGPLSIRPAHLLKLLPWYLGLRKVSQPDNFSSITKALARLNDRSMSAFEDMMSDIGLAGQIHHKGALTVYEKASSYQAEARDWDVKRSLGVNFHEVDAKQIKVLEPHLSDTFEMGVMLEDWAHINDPQHVVNTLREILKARGAELITGRAVCLNSSSSKQPSVRLDTEEIVSGDHVLVAAGAWSPILAATIGDRALLESERGYNTTLPASAHVLNREVLFGEKMFVATPLSVGLRIGGAAEFAGLNTAPNYKRSDALLKLARNYIHELDESDSKQWMGNRPTTCDSLPVLGPSPKDKRIFYAFGHGHLGLTQSASTAQMLFDLMRGCTTFIDPSPYLISRFA